MHSCFAVEIEDTLLLFDYFDKSRTPEVDFQGELPDFSNYKKHYIFSSHGHRDHFWLESLKWGMEYPDMVFFLGNDMRFNRKYLERNGIDFSVKERMITARRGETYEQQHLQQLQEKPLQQQQHRQQLRQQAQEVLRLKQVQPEKYSKLMQNLAQPLREAMRS